MSGLTEWLDEEITVCEKCHKASCWLGLFMCEGARNANTVEMRRRDLIATGKENVCYMTKHLKTLDVIKSDTLKDLHSTIQEFKNSYKGNSEKADLEEYVKKIETILEEGKNQNG